MSNRRHVFVLAVYLSTRGFAFALFEGPLSPVDWGVKEIRGPMKNTRCLSTVESLLEHYQPGALVLQNTTPGGTRRTSRIRDLNAAIAELAEGSGIPTIGFSRDEVWKAFSDIMPRTKRALAEAIAKHISAFERYLPPPRKPWMSEDARMSLFDATALVLTFFHNASGRQHPT